MINITEFSAVWKPRILLIVLAAAFVLSYAALYETATAAKYNFALAILWPLLVDGVVLFAVISLAERQAQGLSTAAPWLVLIVFDLASIVLNASYGAAISWQAAIIHALPALVAPLMMKLYTNDIKDAEAAKQAAVEAAKLARSQQRTTRKQAAYGEKRLLKHGNEAAPIAAANDARAAKVEERRAQIIDLKAEQPELTAPQLAELVGASPDTIRRDLKKLNGKVRNASD